MPAIGKNVTGLVWTALKVASAVANGSWFQAFAKGARTASTMAFGTPSSSATAAVALAHAVGGPAAMIWTAWRMGALRT